MFITVKMLQDRVAEASKYVVGAQDGGEKYIWSRLEKLGIFQDETSCDILVSSDCAEGDARRVFCENGEPNQPVPRFRRIWHVLKGEESCEEDKKNDSLISLFGAMKSTSQLSDKELLDSYMIDCPNGIIDELNKRVHGRKFIVFEDKEKGKINKEITLRL